MNNEKLKIPIMAISVQPDGLKPDDFNYCNEKTFIENILFDVYELEKHTNVAHLILRAENQLIYPVFVKWYLVEVSEKVINGEEGYSFGLCLAGEFGNDSFEVEYGYDVEMDREIPKQIIITKN